MRTPVRRPPETASRDRILVVASPYVGDTVVAVPFLRNLRRAFPHHAIDLLAEGRIPADLLHACPYVDAILPWDRPAKRPLAGLPMEVRGRPAWPALAATVACGWSLRTRRYRRAYLLKRSPSAALVAFLARVPERIGHAAALLRPFLTRTVPVVADRHRSDSWLDLLAGDGHDVDDGRLELWADRAAIDHVDRLLERLPAGRRRAFLAVTASDWRRQWPLSRWIEVVRKLVSESQCEIVLCGGTADRTAHAALTAAARGHVHDLSADVPLRELSALMSRMHAFVGVESGLMHVAAACGVPTVAVFDPRTVAAWHPRGRAATVICGAAAAAGGSRRRIRPPVGSDAAWLAGEALATVSVDTVLERVRALLPRSEAPGPRLLDLRTGPRRYAVLVGSARVAAEATAGS